MPDGLKFFKMFLEKQSQERLVISKKNLFFWGLLSASVAFKMSLEGSVYACMACSTKKASDLIWIISPFSFAIEAARGIH